ncbi:Clp protease N-terminal domain-containing protein [Streptomyces sp. NPDC058534]|uniref:Clp protease N-terminal domain-containing protein n=1 Tax=Streptomyces sp. NPDC058534 TaxID=3346541 RepID=UPI00365F724D
MRCRHVARALLDPPDSRAREALVLQRLDLDAAAAGLDRLDADASAATEGAESRGVAMLRQAGTLGRSGNRLTRALMSWTSGRGANGSPVLGAEHGSPTVGTVHLLAALLDEANAKAGVGEVLSLLLTQGVDPVALRAALDLRAGA